MPQGSVNVRAATAAESTPMVNKATPSARTGVVNFMMKWV